jgi:hypothetical protein
MSPARACRWRGAWRSFSRSTQWQWISLDAGIPYGERCVMIRERGIAWWGCVMIEAKITFYVFYLATAAVAGMLIY